MYAMVGLIYGFVSNYIQIPICQYVFGPMGEPGRASIQQCNISTSVSQLPWNFKVFYGFFLDRVGFFGTRRKGWIIFGWSSALVILACMSVFAQELADDGKMATYMFLLMAMCFFYIFSDVAGDGMTIELSKLEAPEVRGYILTTGQLVRFVATTITNIFGILAMNGTSYYPQDRSGRQDNDTVFPFQLEFWQVHLVLCACATPLLVAMIFLLKDPPRPAVEVENYSMKQVAEVLWNVMKTKIMFFLIVFALGNMAVASLLNPAANIIAFIAGPTTLQNSVGTLAGNVTFLIGVILFRRFFMNRNWRVTFVWTTMLLATNCGFQLLVIFNAWGVGQDGWFYAFGNNVLMIIQGIAQVLSSLAVVEVAPVGFEATVYEFLTTIHNAGITLNSNFQNLFVPIFHLNGIACNYFPNPKHDCHSPNLGHDYYDQAMAKSTYFTLAANIFGALTFCWFLPRDKAQCRTWLEDVWWRRNAVGVLNLVVGGGVLMVCLVMSILSTLPLTNCLKIAGGQGC